MRITIPIQKETDEDNYLVNWNGLTDLTLRLDPFSADNYSLSAVSGVNGIYETTESVTASGNYKVYKNGVDTKIFGSTGKFFVSDYNLLNAEDFNVGETIICQSLSGQNYFVPINLEQAVSNSVSSLTASLNVYTYKAKVRSLGQDSGLEILAVYENTWQSGQVWDWNGTGMYTSQDFEPDTIYTEDKIHEFNEWHPVYDNSEAVTQTGLIGYYRLNLYLLNASIIKIETVDTNWQYSDFVFQYGQTINFQYSR